MVEFFYLPQIRVYVPFLSTASKSPCTVGI
jgi:hypothetical protein